MVTLFLKQLDHAQDLPLPSYATDGASGLDLPAALESDIILQPGERALFPTGLIAQIPEGYEGQIRTRSGLSLKQGLMVLNSPGTIDADYRGEIKVLLINMGQEAVMLHRGMRIAQLVICPVTRVRISAMSLVDQTVRGTGGFGSTGVL